jgi:hypothetical protein
MKQISISIFFILYFFSIHAQDTIYLKNKKVIHAFITEKSDTKIKYKTDSIQADTTYSAKLSKVKTIHYGNGEVDLLSSQNPRRIFPFGVNVGADYFFGLIFFDVSIDYLFLPNISAEINYRTMFDYPYLSLYSVGGKYWFANKYSKSGFSTFTGLFYTQSRIKNNEDDIVLLHEPMWSVDNYLEVPIGISYITKFGFQASLQMDFLLSYESNKFNIGGGLIEFRLGWRFKTSK